MVVKTKQAWTSLQDQFTARSISKRYIAVIAGRPPAQTGTISIPVDYKTAVSDYKVLSSFSALAPPAAPSGDSSEKDASSEEDACSEKKRTPKDADAFVTTLELTPHHGRTHQLRVHCSEGLGAPIVGDNRYGSHIPPESHGLLLAAVGLSFTHPVTGEQVNLAMEEPARFQAFREAYADLASPVQIEDTPKP